MHKGIGGQSRIIFSALLAILLCAVAGSNLQAQGKKQLCQEPLWMPAAR